MMAWILAAGLAAIVLLAMAFLFRVPRAGLTSVASALMLGLAGYALQGDPSQPGAPKEGAEANRAEGPLIVSARQRMFDNAANPRAYMILADGFTRQGQFEEAATILAEATRNYPQDAEAWTALGNVLVAHAEGRLAPPAAAAFERAREADPGSVAPGFFEGIAQLRAGNLIEAHKAWTAALRAAPPDAPGRAEVGQRLSQLEAVIRKIAGM